MSARGYTARELAGLPGMPTTARAVRLRAVRDRWTVAESSGARAYLAPSLPRSTQEALVARSITTAPADAPTETPSAKEAHLARATQHARLAMAVAELVAHGAPLLTACAQVAEASTCSARSIRRWYDQVREHPRTEWVTRLLPQWRSSALDAQAECHPDAWSFVRDDYLRQSKPALRACYRRMVDVAKTKGWSPIPSYHAIRRRLAREVPVAVRVYKRQGTEALSRLYPAQARDRSCFRPMQAITGDGHLVDVMVLWPDGKRARPMLIGLQDIASSKVVAFRADRSENSEVVRLTVADMLRDYGSPEEAYFDNGRVWAGKQMTGGQLTRYRHRIRPEDPEGLITSLGIRVTWTLPYHGQSKPIERAWRDFCEDIARHPAFERAYVGSDPTRRPENYSEDHAVPLERFLAVLVQAVRAHNARPGRAAYGGRSFDEVFAEGMQAGQVRRVTEWQRRLLYLAIDRVRARSLNGEVHLFGGRYWAPELVQHKGAMLTARFDPQDLSAGLYLYTAKGQFICHAAAQAKVPFNSADAARATARARGAFVKAQKELAKAAQKFTPRELGDAHLAAGHGAGIAPVLTTNVIAGVFGMSRESLPPVAPTPEEIARRDAEEASVLELGRAANAELSADRVDDDLVLELGRASLAKLAGDLR